MSKKRTHTGLMLLMAAAAMLLTAVIAVRVLYSLSSDAKTAALTGGEYVFSAGELNSGLWLLRGSSDLPGEDGLSLTIRTEGEADCSLLMLSSLAEGLTINGRAANSIGSGSYSLITLPQEQTLVLSFSRDKGRLLLTARNESLYFGRTEFVQKKLGSINTSSGIQDGFFLFSILFSAALYVFKPSEKYLLFFAAHACIPRLLGAGSVLAGWFPTAAYWLSMVEQSYIYQYLYILINGTIHWLIYREFVKDRIGKHPYILYLAAQTAVITLLTAFIPGMRGNIVVTHLLYFTMYLLEGFILFRFSRVQKYLVFTPVLIAGWFFSLIFWTVRALNNLGYIEFPYTIGTYVALGYTVSFLLCIGGKFAGKFTQADRLLLHTRSLNAELSELNGSLEQKVAERTAALQQAVENLERTQASKNALMTNIIHNLKTPLFSLKGYAELLKEEKELSDPDSADITYLSHICSNVDYLQDMIKQLLLFDRLEEKKITFHIVKVSLAGLLGRLESAEYVALRSKNIKLEITNDTAADTAIYADEFYLKQAIICILDNAIRHSPVDSRIELGAAAAADGSSVLITITDHGRGMSPGVCAHIFERGYSHHENGEKSSGLGLNIALEIVREHGGNISVTSAEGKGSSFIIQLPVCPDDTPDERPDTDKEAQL